jgi:hypothetical protein
MGAAICIGGTDPGMRSFGRGLLYWLAVVALLAVTRDVVTAIQGLDVRWGYTALDAIFLMMISIRLLRAQRRHGKRGAAAR